MILHISVILEVVLLGSQRSSWTEARSQKENDAKSLIGWPKEDRCETAGPPSEARPEGVGQTWSHGAQLSTHREKNVKLVQQIEQCYAQA